MKPFAVISERIIEIYRKSVKVLCTGDGGNAADAQLYVAKLSGRIGSEIKNDCNILLDVPSHDAANSQERHMSIGHTIYGSVEQKLFTK